MDVDRPSVYFDSEHRITKADLRDHFDEVVSIVNYVPGPRLAPVEDKGYGLFAERRYKIGEPVTVYGGVWTTNRSGPYVVSFPKTTKVLDGEYGFLPDEKGRWINDPQTHHEQSPDELKSLENVNLVIRGLKKPVFHATRAIEKGEELLWYYGDDYQRHWIAVHEEGESTSLLTTSEEEEYLTPVQPRPLTVRERLRHAGKSEEEIEEFEVRLAVHGYSLASFDVKVASIDPQRISLLPRDMRYFMMRHIVDGALLETKDDPCVGVGYLMKVASTVVSMAKLLNSDDELWHRFFVQDFEHFDERCHLWTRRFSMPWRSAYLWTVFFRRRCLRELARLRIVGLEGAYEESFGSIPFGAPGCVTALAVYHRDWEDPVDLRQFVGYVNARDLNAGGTYVHASRDPATWLETLRSGGNGHDTDPPDRPFDIFRDRGAARHTNPSNQLFIALRYLQEEHPTYPELERAWSAKLNPAGTSSLAAFVSWDYGLALFAYCWMQVHHYREDTFHPYFARIFEHLPEIPALGKLLFLGAQITE